MRASHVVSIVEFWVRVQVGGTRRRSFGAWRLGLFMAYFLFYAILLDGLFYIVRQV